MERPWRICESFVGKGLSFIVIDLGMVATYLPHNLANININPLHITTTTSPKLLHAHSFLRRTQACSIQQCMCNQLVHWYLPPTHLVPQSKHPICTHTSHADNLKSLQSTQSTFFYMYHEVQGTTYLCISTHLNLMGIYMGVNLEPGIQTCNVGVGKATLTPQYQYSLNSFATIFRDLLCSTWMTKF